MINRSNLTIRQRNILTLKAQGLRAIDIAPILLLSKATVEQETRFILVKLNAQNAAHAVFIALERHLIHPNGHKTPLENG